ncbi:MAG: hypothetical protein IVW36_07605 [Dehalococcoidia bacterium]|nr:hypothetical protein [Dehalococcoidia bacterium]
MHNLELYPECPTHGGRIVTRFETERALRERRGDANFNTLPDDVPALFAAKHHPFANVDSGRLLCDECGDVADTIHLLPTVVGVSCIQASCREHDFGGYAIPMDTGDGLTAEPFRWLHHLSTKVQFEATLVTLVAWLDFEGAVALDRHRAA